MKRNIEIFIVVFGLICSSPAFSKVQVSDDGSTNGNSDVVGENVNEPHPAGHKSAERYMGVKPTRSISTIGSDNHYLAIHLGAFVSSTSYQWGANPRIDNVGALSAGVTYRIGEWVNSMDFLVRADINSYGLPEGRAIKLSLLPMITFPDAASSFPLYFGVGAGLGIFLQQISQESSISLDYELVAGIRFFNVIDTTGFFVESGLKNHLLLLSDGQYNGVFVAAGALFTF